MREARVMKEMRKMALLGAIVERCGRWGRGGDEKR
jgi:hypothetical protein